LQRSANNRLNVCRYTVYGDSRASGFSPPAAAIRTSFVNFPSHV